MPESDFGEALRRLKLGKAVARHGWNGKGMWIFLVATWGQEEGGLALPPGFEHVWEFPQRPVICMRDAQGFVTVGWAPSQPDMLAEDWSEVEPA